LATGVWEHEPKKYQATGISARRVGPSNHAGCTGYQNIIKARAPGGQPAEIAKSTLMAFVGRFPGCFGSKTSR